MLKCGKIGYGLRCRKVGNGLRCKEVSVWGDWIWLNVWEKG